MGYILIEDPSKLDKEYYSLYTDCLEVLDMIDIEYTTFINFSQSTGSINHKEGGLVFYNSVNMKFLIKLKGSNQVLTVDFTYKNKDKNPANELEFILGTFIRVDMANMRKIHPNLYDSRWGLEDYETKREFIEALKELASEYQY